MRYFGIALSQEQEPGIQSQPQIIILHRLYRLTPYIEKYAHRQELQQAFFTPFHPEPFEGRDYAEAWPTPRRIQFHHCAQTDKAL